MNAVTLVFPENTTSLQEKYSEVLADIVSGMLTPEELEYLIKELEKN